MAGNYHDRLPFPSSRLSPPMVVGEEGTASSPETRRTAANSPPFSPSIAGEHPAVRRAVVASPPNSEKKGFRVSSPRGKISGRFGFKNGDIVWAKAFAYTWWPGRVERIQGSSALVAFYGCDRVKWFAASKIFDFEEHYARMVRMMGVKLADNIALAVEELQRRAVLGLMCPCRSSAAEACGVKADRIQEAKSAFEIRDMLYFLLDVAVCTWIVKEEVVRAAKMSEQVIAYMKHVLICVNSKVDDAFCSEDFLQIVRSATVSWYTGDCEIRDNLKAQVQLSGFRQFVSVHPSWVYCQIEAQRENLIARTYGDTYKEMHWPSPQKDLLLGVSRETDYYFQHQQDEDFEAPKEQSHVDRELCTVNRADFSVLDIDQGYMSPMDYKLEVLAGSSRAFWAGKFCNSEIIDIQNPSSEISINMGDNAMTRVEGIHSMRVSNQTAGSGTRSKIKEQHMELSSYDGNECHENAVYCLLGNGDFDQSQEQVSYSATTLTSAKKQKLQLQDGNSEDIEPATNNRVVETLSSVDSSLLQATSMPDKRFVVHKPSSSLTQFPNEKLTSNVEMHCKDNHVGTEDAPSSNVKLMSNIVPGARGLVVSQHTSCPPNKKLTSDMEMYSIFKGDVAAREEVETPSNNVKSMSSLASVEITSLEGATKESSCKKRRCDHPVSGGSFKLNKKQDHCSMKLLNFASDQTGDKIISTKELETEKTITLENAKYPEVSSENDSIVSCKISRGSHSLKCSSSTLLSEDAAKFLEKRRLDRAVDSDTSMWTRFYASPLVSTASGSSIKTLNSPGNDRHNGSPKTFYMKFPKDFNLPSKDELQKKFRVFGPLDNSKTRVFFYTGVAQVGFFNKSDAIAAYRFVKRKSIFGHAKVHFWFDNNEKSGNACIDKTNWVKGEKHQSHTCH